MRGLSERQAKNCEEAREPVCKCRCQGKAHGAQRGGVDAPMQFYYDLPEDDPHAVLSPERRAAIQQEKRDAKRQARREWIEAADQAQMAALTALYDAQRTNDEERICQAQAAFLEAYNYAHALRKET